MAHRNLLKGFKRPHGLKFEKVSGDPFFARFTAGPFEKGFAVTVGNSLRRVLMSSLPGYAFTAIKVDGVPHEISQMEGVAEDTIDVILNLKQVRLRLKNDLDSKTILFERKGPGVVRAKDLAVDSDIEVMNPGMQVATLDKDANITWELQIDFGRGYRSAEQSKEYIETIGTIPMDANFSPIVKVNHAIENMRVGQKTDYEKLVLEIWTDGTISPEDALGDAAKILKDHFNTFINFEETPEVQEEAFNEQEEKLKAILNTSVEELELSVRSSNCLREANIKTIGELVQKSEEEMLRTSNFGKKSLNEIVDKLAALGLSLGMKEINYLSKIKSEKPIGKT